MGKKPTYPKPPSIPVPNQDGAVCKNLDPDIFFDDGDTDADFPNAAAQAACGRCPLEAECLQWAYDTNQKFGIWGGKTPRQRLKLTRAIPRAHCPGCQSNAILEEPTSETCLSCGLSWRI